MRRKNLSIALVIAILTLACAFGCSKKFDSAAWQSADLGEDNDRYLMVNSLKRRLKVGMLREDVHELLGVPDDAATELPDGWIDAYQIRFYSNMFDYDTDYFNIEYDSDGRVRQHYISTVPG